MDKKKRKRVAPAETVKSSHKRLGVWSREVLEKDAVVEKHVEGISRMRSASRPRLHTAMFEDALRNEESTKKIVKEGIALEDPRAFEQKTRNGIRKIEEATKGLGWPSQRLANFQQLVVQYRKDPSIENYLCVRREFPEVEIQLDQFGGPDAVWNLEDEFKKVGLETKFISGVLDFHEPAVDTFCLRLLEMLMARGKLKHYNSDWKSFPMPISDAMVAYLIVTMLEAFDRHSDEEVRVPTSLVVLIRHQLFGKKKHLHVAHRTKTRRGEALHKVAKCLKPGEELSIKKLMRMADLPKTTAARWLRDGFEHEVAWWQKSIERHNTKFPKSASS
jgi:hypothetical protein